MTLPLDYSRCAGRYDFEPDGKWCPMRDACQRYLAFTQWDKQAGIPDYRGIAVTMAADPCNSYLEQS